MMPAEQAPPIPMVQGRYAIYETPEGGRVIAYRADGQDESQQFMIPPPAMRIIERMMSGENISPMEIMKAAMGR